MKRKRQAMTVTPNQLRLLADNLEKELGDIRYIITDKTVIGDIKFSISIVNKQPKCSDTWEIE